IRAVLPPDGQRVRIVAASYPQGRGIDLRRIELWGRDDDDVDLFRAFLAQRHRIRRCRDRHGTGVDGDRTTSRTHTAILVRDSELQREDARSIIVCAADTEPGTA